MHIELVFNSGLNCDYAKLDIDIVQLANLLHCFVHKERAAKC